MQLHLIIDGLGGAQPVIQITGSQAGIYTFIWDTKRSAHVLTYDFDKPGEEEKFRREQRDLLNQHLHWPVTLDVSLDAVNVAIEEEQAPEVKEPEAPLESEKPSEELQDGEVASRFAHNEETEGSSPSPAISEVDVVPESPSVETLEEPAPEEAPLAATPPAPKKKSHHKGKGHHKS